MGAEYRHGPRLELRAIDSQARTFTGYASSWGGPPDAYGDIVQRGAFLASLDRQTPKLLWMHLADSPIGTFDEIREDAHGLFVKGRLSSTTLGNDALTLLRDGALDGLSIGFRILKSTRDDRTGIRTLTEIDLLEVSVVTFPANARATVGAVKSLPLARQLDVMRDLLARQSELIDAGIRRIETARLAQRPEVSNTTTEDVQRTQRAENLAAFLQYDHIHGF